MGLTYFKRYRMQIKLPASPFPETPLPPHYWLVPWQETDLKQHADAQYRSFRYEMDAHVFSRLGNYDGCLYLLRETSRREDFLPESTWLLKHQPPGQPPEACGTIQGVASNWMWGAIQNIGITPEHRGLGLGAALIRRSLEGFRQAGLKRVCLQVTAKNTQAVALYRRLGFTCNRIVYRIADVEGA